MSCTLFVMRRATFLIIFILAAMLPIFAGAVGSSTIYLRANPDSVVADGKSVATVSAEVRDSTGNLVPDGTLVSFSSSLGTIPSTATTAAGVARVRLMSDTTVGTAEVSAWVTDGGAVAQIKVPFLSPGTEIPRLSYVTISSNSYLVYDPATMVAYASGGVTIFHRGLTITANEAQYDLKLGVIKCRCGSSGEPITLTRAGKTVQTMLLSYNINNMTGKAVRESDSGKIERINLRGADLQVDVDKEDVSETIYDFADISESSALVKSKSMTVRPGKDIQFRRAQIFLEGEKMVTVPLHVMDFDNTQAQGSKYIGWGVNGLKIDLPWYYSLSPSTTGSLHLTRGQSGGWGFASSGGWSLDAVEDYATESGGQGTFAVNRVLWRDWGAHWNHTQQFDSGDRVYTDLEFPAHKDVYGMVNYSKQLTKLSIGMNVSGDKYQDQPGDVRTDLYLQTIPKRIANGNLNYILLNKYSYAAGGQSLGSGFGTGLQMQLFSKPFIMSKQSTVNSSLSFGQDWGGTLPGFSVIGNTSYNYRLGRTGNFSLIYGYTHGPGYQSLYGNHRLTANFNYSPTKRWRARLFSTYTLDANFSSTLGDVSYQITPNWRLGLFQRFQASTFLLKGNPALGTHDTIVDSNNSDTEISLGRKLGDHELSVMWSKSEHQFQLGFDAAQF